MTQDPSLFQRQLLHWSIHTVINAIPSFFLAFIVGFGTVKGVSAMVLGIATMIFAYTWISCLAVFAGNPSGLLNKAAHYGARCRTGICLLSLPMMVPFDGLSLIGFMPDLWAGMVALHAVGLDNGNMDYSGAHFIQVYAATILEAFMVSISVFLLALLVLGLFRFIRITAFRQRLSG